MEQIVLKHKLSRKTYKNIEGITDEVLLVGKLEDVEDGARSLTLIINNIPMVKEQKITLSFFIKDLNIAGTYVQEVTLLDYSTIWIHRSKPTNTRLASNAFNFFLSLLNNGSIESN